MRLEWPANFPDLRTHGAYEALKGHHNYKPAKKAADVDAAVTVCETFTDGDGLQHMYDRCLGNPPPIVVAPAVALGETNNALARTYASWLAEQLGLQLETEILQVNTAVKRDLITTPYNRLVRDPIFEGPVIPGRRYALADDVCTLGGTLASLAGFIRGQGGEIIYLTSLATSDGNPRRISLAPETRNAIYGKYDGRLAELIEKDLGYEACCLTEAEAQYLLARPSFDAIRKGLSKARASTA